MSHFSLPPVKLREIQRLPENPDFGQSPVSVMKPAKFPLAPGFICLGLGVGTSWFIGIGHAFFLAAAVIGIVAIAKNRVWPGTGILVASVALPTLILYLTIYVFVRTVEKELVGLQKDAEAEFAKSMNDLDREIKNSMKPIDDMLRSFQQGSQRSHPVRIEKGVRLPTRIKQDSSDSADLKNKRRSAENNR